MIINNSNVNCIILNDNPINSVYLDGKITYRQSIENLKFLFLDNFSLSQLDNMIIGSIDNS